MTDEILKAVENPLMEKWRAKYLPTPDGSANQLCDGYTCMWCGRCPLGNEWTCPEEDIEEYNKYLEKLDRYTQEHPGWVRNFIVSSSI